MAILGIINHDTLLFENSTGNRDRGSLYKGKQVEVLERSSSRSQVRVKDGNLAGKVGYVRTDRITMDN